MNLIKEKGELEKKIGVLEARKSTADKQAKQCEAQVAGLEAHKSALEVLLKTANEQKEDIAPLKKEALFLRNKIYQMQVQIAEEVFKFKQIEDVSRKF